MYPEVTLGYTSVHKRETSHSLRQSSKQGLPSIRVCSAFASVTYDLQLLAGEFAAALRFQVGQRGGSVIQMVGVRDQIWRGVYYG